MELLIIAVFQFDITLTDRTHIFTARETSGFLLPAISRARSPTTSALLDIINNILKFTRTLLIVYKKRKSSNLAW